MGDDGGHRECDEGGRVADGADLAGTRAPEEIADDADREARMEDGERDLLRRLIHCESHSTFSGGSNREQSVTSSSSPSRATRQPIASR